MQTMESISAAHRAFGSIELLESILYELPMEDVFRYQAISPSWRDVIGRNKRLQQVLFFRPIETSDSEAMRQLNPLLLHVFWPLFQHDSPLVQNGGFDKILSMDSPAGKDALLRQEASWRRMLLTQPPICKLSINFITPIRYGGFHGWVQTLDLPDGLRMSPLYYTVYDRYFVAKDYGSRIRIKAEHSSSACQKCLRNKYDWSKESGEDEQNWNEDMINFIYHSRVGENTGRPRLLSTPTEMRDHRLFQPQPGGDDDARQYIARFVEEHRVGDGRKYDLAPGEFW